MRERERETEREREEESEREREREREREQCLPSLIAAVDYYIIVDRGTGISIIVYNS